MRDRQVGEVPSLFPMDVTLRPVFPRKVAGDFRRTYALPGLSVPDGTEHWKNAFQLRGIGEPGEPMSKYLNDLIKSLQEEIKEHEAALEQQPAPTGRGFHRDTGYLDRLQQRIKTLQELQVSEAQRHRHLFRSAAANSKRRVAVARNRDVARIH
jgi:hypothetical protein